MKSRFYSLSADRVRTAATGHWPGILSALCGLTEVQTTPSKRGMPCPYCNGHDRYEFKSPDDGHYMCRGCGAGDGFSLVMKINQCNFLEALHRVADYLNMDNRPDRPPPSRFPQRPVNTPPSTNSATENKAQGIYNNAPQADRNHPYLVKKKLPSNYFRMYRGNLLVPVYSPEFTVVNLQFIRPDGAKFFLKNGRVKGCFVWYGNRSSWSVYVCEGVANAISIHLLYNRMAVAAFSVDNITPVAQFLRQRLPEHRLVLYMDNDRPTEQRPWRPGASALYGHQFFHAVEIPPPGCDASDLYIRAVSRG